MEKRLHPFLEIAIGEKMSKTVSRYDSVDFESPQWYVELKARSKQNATNPITSKTYATWLLPTCKSKMIDKNLVFFYYYEGDDTLFYIVYDQEQFDTFTKMWITKKDGTRQEHFLIPADAFTLIPWERLKKRPKSA